MNPIILFVSGIFVLVPAMTTMATVTTQPNQFTWNTPQAVIQPGIIHFASTLMNNPITSPAPKVIIALANNTQSEPYYQIQISYIVAEQKYTVFISKQDTMGILGTLNIQKLETPSVWEVLEAWRTGTEQKLAGSYTNGTFIISIGGRLLWRWTDDTPHMTINRVTISSIDTHIQYKNLVITGSMPVTESNLPYHIAFNPNSPVLLTFKSTALPENLNCSLYRNNLEKAQYSIDFQTNPVIQTTVTHRLQPTSNSAIPTSTGSYTLAAPTSPAQVQTYFIFYSPTPTNTTIAFGLLSDTLEQQPLMYWQNPTLNEPSCNSLSIMSSTALNELTLSSSPITLSAPTNLGLTREANTYRAQGLNRAVAYKNNSTEWAHSFAFPKADEGIISFDLQMPSPQTITGNGAVILLGTQASGQPLYGIQLEPDVDSALTSSTQATRTRVRLFSLASGILTYVPNSAILEGHILEGRYQITYKKTSSSQATISLHKITTTGPNLLTTLTLDGVSSGVCCATLSSQNGLVSYTNVVISAPANSQTNTSAQRTIDLDSLSIIQCLGTEFAFNWNHSALQQLFDSTKGLTLETTIEWDTVNKADKTIVIGLSPATIDSSRKYFFNDTVARFTGAAQLLAIAIKETTIEFKRFIPTPEGTSAVTASRQIKEQSISGTSCRLWLSYEKKDTDYTVTVGINTPRGTDPLFSWNDTRTTQSADFSKVGLSSWNTPLTYKNITLSPYVAPTRINNPTPTETKTPNTLIRTKNTSELVYEWDLGKTSQNPNGIIDKQYGGMLTADVQITERDALNTATLMIGLTSDTSKNISARSGGVEIFKSAEYNIQIQATDDNGFVSLRRAATSGDSPFDGANTATLYKNLTPKGIPAAQWPTYRIWVRYTPQQTSRLFEVGLNALSNPTQAADYSTPLWTFTEANIPASRSALEYISISSWNTGCIVKNVAVIQAPKPLITPTQTLTDSGTITATNLPQQQQWNPGTVITIRPNTLHRLTAIAPGADRIVIAFSKSQTNPRTIDFRIVLTPEGVSLFEKNIPAPQLSSLNTDGKLKAEGANYWFSIANGIFSFGGYTATDILPNTPYLRWAHDMLKGSNTWYCTTGASADASITHLGGTIISTVPSTQTTTTTTLPALLRNRPVGQVTRPQQTGPASPNRPNNRLLTSAELEQRRYRINTPLPAQQSAQSSAR